MIVVTPSGEQIPLGEVETAPTIGIVDRSRRVTDDFGVTTVVERGFARTMSVRLAIPVEEVDEVQRRLAELRATASTWIADERFRSMSLKGFYKDFSVDHATPAIVYCSLTVESLTGSDIGADAGGDPSPDEQPSTLQLLQPIAITGAALVASSVTEADHPEWSAGTGYGIGARVIRAATHRIYESVIAGNLGNDPVAAGGQWLEVGPTNRWAMFDQALGTSTTNADAVAVTIDGAIGAVALLDVSADAVRVQAEGYDRTQPAGAGAITFLDLPVGTTRVTVTVTGAQVTIGTLLAGALVGLGTTETAPTTGITDYSRKATDDFGDVEIVQRAFAKRMTARALIRTDALDDVAGRIAAVRARPSLWIGQAGTDSLTIYGFFKEFSVEVGETLSKLSLSIEGLSKAAPLPKPITSVVAQGSVDGVTWHLGLQPGDIFLRISNDSGRNFGAAVRVAGRDAFTAYLTNSDHTLPALFDGTVTSYAGAESIFVIGLGGQDLTDSGQFDLSIASNPQNLTVVITGRHFRVTGGLDAGEDSATLVMRLTGSGQFASVVVDQVFSLTKSKGGRNGEAPALISLSASALTARYDTAGLLVPGQAITFGARRQNTIARTLFTLRNSAGAVVHGPYEPGEFARLGGSSLWSAFDPDTITLTEAGIVAVIRDHGGATGRVTMVASIEGTGLTDAVSVNKVQDGARGADGTSPYNAILSNETHTLPADAAGNVLSYAGAEFTLTVFYGSQDVTGSFRLDTSENPQALFGPSDLYPTYRIDGGLDAGEPSASVTYHFIGKDGTPHAGKRVSKVFSLSKSLGGSNGAPAALVSLSASALTVRYDTAGVLVPGQAVTFAAKKQNTGARTVFTLRNSVGQIVHGPYYADDFARFGGSTFWSAADGDTITLTEAGIVAVVRDHGGTTGRVTMIASIEGTALADAVSLQKVQDGAKGADGTSPYNAILSNETHTLPADAAGNVLSYAGAEFTLTVFYGSQDVTGSFRLDTSENPQALFGPSDLYPTYRIDGGLDAGEPSASVTYHFIGKDGTPHAGKRVSKVFSLSKSLGGSNGAPAALVSLSASALTVRYDTAGVLVPGQAVTFAAKKQNTGARTVFTLRNSVGQIVHGPYYADDFARFGGSTFWSAADGDTITLTEAGIVAVVRDHGGTTGRVTMIASIEGTALADAVSLQKVQDGAKGADGKNAVNVIADNETFTVPTDPAGNYAAFPVDVSRGHLRVYDGVTEVTGQCTFTIQNPFNLDGRIDGTGAYYAVGLYGDTGYSDVIAIYNGVAYPARLTASKVKGGAKGLDGVNPPLISVSANPQAIRYDKDNVIASGPVTFTAVLQNALGPVGWEAPGGIHPVYGRADTMFSGNTMTITAARMAEILNYNEANGGIAAQAFTASASGVSDRVTVTKVKDGAKGADSTVPGPPGADSTVPGPPGKDGINGLQNTGESQAFLNYGAGNTGFVQIAAFPIYVAPASKSLTVIADLFTQRGAVAGSSTGRFIAEAVLPNGAVYQLFDITSTTMSTTISGDEPIGGDGSARSIGAVSSLPLPFADFTRVLFRLSLQRNTASGNPTSITTSGIYRVELR